MRKECSIPAANKPGKPKKIDTVTARKTLRSFNTGEYKNAVDAARKLGANGVVVCPQKVRNLLLSARFTSGLKKRALPLTAKQCKVRLAWAKKYQHLTKVDWGRRVFSDETKINRLGSDGKQWTWKQDGTLQKFVPGIIMEC